MNSLGSFPLSEGPGPSRSLPTGPTGRSGGSRRGGAGVIIALFLGLLVLTGCAPGEVETGPEIDVTGEFGRRPQVAFDPPVEITHPGTSTVIPGEGKTLEEGDPVLVAYVALSASTGEVLDESYAREPRSLTLTSDAGPLYEELLGVQEGTRLLSLSQGTIGRPDPVVVVYDVLHTQAWGEEVEPADDASSLPQVTRGEGGRPEVEIPDTDPPSQLRILTLIRGEGPQVQEGGSLTAQYSTVEWSSGEELDSTWEDELTPPAIPLTGRIPAWQDGLSGATVGSQIMIIAPPEDAFGSDSVVFVIDILATTAPENSPDEPHD